MRRRLFLFLLMIAVPACESRDGRPPLPDSTRPRLHVALDGEGVRIVGAPSGSTRLLPFGSPSSSATATVSQSLGDPAERATNLDCGAGPMEFVAFRGGLMLNVQQDRLVGWTVRPGSDGAPTTMSGIGLGSTRAELDAAYDADVRQTTLGTEFSAGSISGVLASDAPTARITDIWAGLSCIAR